MAQREQHERVKRMDRWAGKLLEHKASVVAMLVVIAMASGLAMATWGGESDGVSFDFRIIGREWRNRPGKH